MRPFYLLFTGVVLSLKPFYNTHYCFMTDNCSWSSMNTLRFPRCHASLVNVKDRLFLCGGATRSYDTKNTVLLSLAAVDEYIEEHDMWCHRTDMIIPRHSAGVTVAGKKSSCF